MIRQFKNPRFWIVLSTDILLLALGHLIAYLFRFEGHLTAVEWGYIRTTLPWLIGLKVAVFFSFGLYRGMWRYTGIADLLNISRAVAVSWLLTVGAFLVAFRFEGLSRSVFLMDGLFTLVFIAGHRLFIRLAYQWLGGQVPSSEGKKDKKRILIVGAGDAAEKLTREIRENRSLPYRVVGFIDDDPARTGRLIHNIPVLGAMVDLEKIAAKVVAEEIIIAVPSARAAEMKRIVEACRGTGLPFKTLPTLGEIIDEKVSIKNIRDVSYRDLLGRAPVRLEAEKISEVIDDRVVLVTGAGGSIGSELCRQIIRYVPRLLILLDASEFNLYQIEMELRHEHGFTAYRTVLGQVQEEKLLDHLFSETPPETIFHAAAYKHVPMLEHNPWEAVMNNVVATRKLVQTAIDHKVERFILVSTDKAVRPTNVMGATKRMTEKIMQAICAGGCGATRFMAVRFGNVIGSSGSVIPLFKRQIELGGPVTVTDPEITRYFMSIEEAAQLILQAASMGEGGEIFILKMGTPVKIAQMARDLIRLCGREPDSEIEVRYIGLRPGEKLYEELITEGEGIVATGHEKIMVLRGEECDLEELDRVISSLAESAMAHDADGVRSGLRRMVSGFKPGSVTA